MKSIRNCLIAFLLCFALLSSLVPVPALAAETNPTVNPALDENTSAPVSNLPDKFVYINPMYRDVIDESDLPDGDVPTVYSSRPSKSEYADTLEEAGLEIRRNMKNRTESFVVLLRIPKNDLTQQTYVDMVDYAVQHTGVPTEGDYLKGVYAGWIAQVVDDFLDGDDRYLTILYNMPYFTNAQQEKQMDAAVNQLLNELNLYQANDYEKIKGIYDWICSNVTYDYANLNNPYYMLMFTAYAGLVNRTCVCQGYALLLYRLALELDLDVRYVCGEVPGGPHAWNIVRLGYVWYNADSTWDSGAAEAGFDYKYFLRSEADFASRIPEPEYVTDEFRRDHPMSQTQFDPNVPLPPSDGWVWEGDGWYYYQNYHMVTGWKYISGSWYYFNSNGQMMTGWQWINGSCYYFYGSGAMAADTWIDGSYVDGSGAWVKGAVATGWQSNSTGWWYNDQNGNFVTGWQWIDSNWYYFSSSGYMQTGWQWIDDYWFYLNSSGHIQKGWQWIDSNWFYLDSAGHMLKGWQWIDSYWFYLDSAGHMTKGWQWIDSYWFYLDSAGHMTKGWQWIDSHWFYLDSAGHMMKGWQWIDSHWYYFYNDGSMAVDTTIDGCYVNGSGIWV